MRLKPPLAAVVFEPPDALTGVMRPQGEAPKPSP